MQKLDADKQLVSDLWLDQPDGLERIDRRVAAGEVSEADARLLRDFFTDGYLQLRVDDMDELAAGFEDDLDEIWRTRPADLAASSKSSDRVSFRHFDEENRDIGYRVVDLHSHSPSARDLYLHPDIFRVVELIFDAPAVAFQSLFFQYGSEQSLHRDPMFVVTDPPSHLVASWAALEDISPDSGPLMYVPGSHRMPWFEFAPDTIAADKGGDKELRARWVEFRARMIDEMGLEVKQLACKKGDVFIWHGALLHGGSKVRDENTTRKSFVTHYSTASRYRSRRATMKMRFREGDGETWRGVSGTTERLLTRDGHAGIDNPLREMKIPPKLTPV